MESQRMIYAVEKVGPHHGYLIDDDGINFLEKLDPFVISGYILLYDELGRKLEKRMDGCSRDVDGCNPGWSQDGHGFICRFTIV